jgi:hypothetical protein
VGDTGCKRWGDSGRKILTLSLTMNTVQSGGQGVSTHKKDPGLEVRRILIAQIIDFPINALS